MCERMRGEFSFELRSQSYPRRSLCRTIRDVRWAMTNPKLGKYGAYPATTMWPTTDKTELAEMSESDPRRFSEIRVKLDYAVS